MNDPRIDRLADLLVRYSLKLKPGELVYLTGEVLAEPLMRAFYREALRAGAHVDVRATFPWQEELLLATASDDQLSFIRPLAGFAHERYAARMVIAAPSNTRALSGVDPARQAIVSAANEPVLHNMMQKMASGEYRWTSFWYPTDAVAQEAGMSQSAFEDFVYRTCFLDDPDPVARYQALHDEQEHLIERLRGVREIRVVGRDTDLTLRFGDRPWVNCSGEVNMPDGEFFTCPLEDSASGQVRFTYPAIMQGRSVEDVRLTFESGRVVKASAARNEEYLLQILDSDEGARRLGEFSFGNNPAVTRFVGETAYDEKIKGTVHMALGASITEAGGTNRSGVHWDLVCDLRDGGEAYVDGKLFLKDGRFV